MNRFLRFFTQACIPGCGRTPWYALGVFLVAGAASAQVAERASDLDGRLWRANLARTGEYEASGPAGMTAAWRVETGEPVRGSAVIVGGTAYIGSGDGTLYALALETGDIQWKYDTGAAIEASPLVYRGRVFIGSGPNFFALDRATGTLHWKQHPAKRTEQSPIGINGTVFCSTGYKWGGILTGLDVETGQERWTMRDNSRIGHDGSSAAMYRNHLIYSEGSPGYDITNLETTRKVNEFDAGLDRFVLTPALRDGRMYAVGRSGVVSVDVFKKAKWTEQQVWAYREPHWKDTNPDFSSPAVDEHRMYIGNGDGFLYALDREEGTLDWKAETGGRIISSPALDTRGRVFVGSEDGFVYAFAAADGRELGRFQTGGPVLSSPALADGFLVIGSDDGTIYALR